MRSAEADHQELRDGELAGPAAAPDPQSGSRTDQRFFQLVTRLSANDGAPRAPSTPGMSP